MKKKGFTLVELLAVITLLSLVMIIVVSAISSPYRNMKKDLNESQKKLIISAAETYIQRYKNNYPSVEGNIYCISLNDLVKERLLEDNLVNALEDNKLDLNLGIKVTVDSKISYHFEFDETQSACTK